VAEAGAAMKPLLTEAVGFVAPLPELRCLLVVDFAPVVARIAILVRGLAAPAPPTVRAFALTNARAGDVLALVNRALDAGRPGSGGSSSLRLAAADASNQLISIGTEADLARVSGIVAALDRPPTDAKPDGR
jgi:type II secretory pathway component GspD/PulD (secretin)